MRWILALLVLTSAAAVLGPMLEGRERSAEQSVRAYAAAIAAHEVDGALSLLRPDQRESWRIFVQHQAGDRITIVSTAVGRVPLTRSLRGWQEPVTVTVVADIEGKGEERWRATSLVRGVRDGDRFLLASPPFGPDEPWLVPPES